MTINENKIAEFLEKLPGENDVFYPFRAREIIPLLKEPKRSLLSILENKVKYTEKIRFNALYCLLADLWTRRDYIEYRHFIDRYEYSFKCEHIYLLTFKSQYFACQKKNAPNCQLALEYAGKAKELGSDLPNILHLYTGCILELADVLSDEIEPQLLVKAENSINKAIAIKENINYCLINKEGVSENGIQGGDKKYVFSDHYSARYYATKASLLGKIGRFSEAKELIQKAIELEPSDGEHYALRIGDYQEIRLKIQFLEHKKILNQKQKESIDKLEEVRLKIIELLGLLSAIIAFLVTSIQVGKSFVFEEASRLMVISGGVILIIFSAYSIIFFGEKPKQSQVLVLLFGASMVLTFYFFPDLIQLIKKCVSLP